MLRHGESTLNAEGRITGTLNIELTPKGRIEAVALRDRLMPPYELILSSSLRRAREAAPDRRCGADGRRSMR